MEIEFQLPTQAVLDCHHQGDCEDDCRAWQKELNLGLDRNKMIAELTGYGLDDVETWTNEKMETYCVWLASGNIQETSEFQEYIESEEI